LYAGIDLGGTNLKIGVLDNQNQVVYQDSMPTNADSGPENLISRIESFLDHVLHKFPEIISLGIGVPGVVSNEGIIKIAPNLKGWVNINLKGHLNKKYKIPIAIDNDANTASLAEMVLGAGKKVKDFIYITLGTGVGGAIIINRNLFRGANGGAGEIGHLIINILGDNQGKAEFRQGVLEEYTGRKQIAAIAEQIAEDYPDSYLRKIRQFDPYYISKAAEYGDECALLILKKIGFYLGIGIASAVNLLDIPVIIIGGGLSLSHETLFSSALETIRQRGLPSNASKVEIRRAKFSKDAGIMGACVLGKINLKQV
jgi:glucokinase